MPVSTVNWLWIGNRAAIDPTASSNVTQAQLNAAGMNGYTATGPSQISPVALTGTTNTGTPPVFAAPFNPVGGFISDFSFDSPTTTGTVTGIRIQAAFRGAITLTLPDGTTTNQVATVIQMSNGDIFLRPNAGSLSAWDGITGLRSVTINQATPFPANTVFNSTISFSPDIFDIDIPCFTQGTMILTPTGERRIESLAVGDVVMTMDHGPQVIRWIATRRVAGAILAQRPDLLPIRIKAGALGKDCPETDLVVSPQHRVLVRSRIAERMFEADEVLIAATHLVGLPGIAVDAEAGAVSYTHFLCDAHEVVFANGAPTESLYPGPMALRALGEAASREIMTLFPALRDLSSFGLTPARTLVKGRQGRVLAERHQKNAVQLLAA